MWIRLFYKINQPISSADINKNSTKVICYPEENLIPFYVYKRGPDTLQTRKYYCIDKKCRLHKGDAVHCCVHLVRSAENRNLFEEVRRYFRRKSHQSHEYFRQ